MIYPRSCQSLTKLSLFCCRPVLLMLVAVLLGCRGDDRIPASRVDEIKRAMRADANQLELPLGPASFVLVRIPPGEFEIGSPPTEEGHQLNESPTRRVQ